MTEKRFEYDNGCILDNTRIAKAMTVNKVVECLNTLHEENQQLKSDLARVIEQARKNNELCVSDIRILEKALWCTGCENDYDRLRQLRKEFLKMTEKRFVIEDNCCGYTEIIDNEKELDLSLYNPKKNLTIEELVDLLNELHNENEQLKQQIGNLEHTRDFCADVCADCERLEEENEQLKQYIYDNLDEDICDVCSYQYLEKSQMDKYYVAKCKKGYDNCSKGTVIHCKDFKFKELQE